jgi:hypothetical protein
MTSELSHERCSEILGDFVRGELDATEAEAVERHLAHCDACSEEHSALQVLLAPLDTVLSEHERARLERNVAGELGDVIPVRRDGSSAWTKVAQSLGAVALIAIIGVGIVQLGTGGGGDDSGAANGGSDTAATTGQANDATKGSAEGATSAGGAVAAAPKPRPSFDRKLLDLTDKKFRALGKSSQLRAFSDSYSADDVARLKNEYTNELALAAPTADQQTLVRQCAQRVFDSTESYSLLPAYAADARLNGREALILGFAWTNKQAGPLDQYMLWVWPVADCDAATTPLDYNAGQIGKK